MKKQCIAICISKRRCPTSAVFGPYCWRHYMMLKDKKKFKTINTKI